MTTSKLTLSQNDGQTKHRVCKALKHQPGKQRYLASPSYSATNWRATAPTSADDMPGL
jgi:hypothetical protein